MIEPPQQKAIPVKSACELPDKIRALIWMFMLSPCCMHSALQWYGMEEMCKQGAEGALGEGGNI